MSKKSSAIAKLIESSRGDVLDAHYLAYFECFNRKLFYEAHDVLEELWLTDRLGPNGNFYKGLIQLAGAFVHLQKRRPGPAAALFGLARSNLERYPGLHEELNLTQVLLMIRGYLDQLAVGPGGCLELRPEEAPLISLVGRMPPGLATG